MSREYVINREGQVLRRTITETPVELSAAALSKLASAPKQIRNVFPMGGWGAIHMSIQDATCCWLTVPVEKIQLRAPFKPIKLKGEQVLVPNFSSETDPVMTITWTVVEHMRLRMLCQCGNSDGQVVLAPQWLFAYDEGGRTWRLPLPNTHDDCSLCTGNTNGESAPTMAEALDKALIQFTQSVWNADLWGDSVTTQSMFRFAPDAAKGFNQLPFEGKDWTKHCYKVATAISQHVIL